MVPWSVLRMADRAVVVIRANHISASNLLIGFGAHSQTKAQKERIDHSIAEADRASNHVTRHHVKGTT